MQAITSRWLLRMLPWVQTAGGVYRVNRRRTYVSGDGRVSFDFDGGRARVIAQELTELPLLHGFTNERALESMADRFEQQTVEPGNVIVSSGQPRDRIFLIAHGKVRKNGPSEYDGQVTLAVLSDGDYFGDDLLAETPGAWENTFIADTRCTLLALSRGAYEDLLREYSGLRAHAEQLRELRSQPQNAYGEALVDMKAGHDAEASLPGTFVDYERDPAEYELSAAQTVLRVSTRVADLYNDPMNQVEQQLRLTIEALREQQEEQLVNNPDFGLLHNVDLRQRIPTRSGPPTPDDLDELLSLVWKEPTCLLAHPRTIAAIGRECNRAGVYPQNIDVLGHQVPAWRGVPILPCNKIPINNDRTSSVMLLRTGSDNQGVIGLHQTGIPDEYQPGLSVRFMGIDDKAIISYLVTAYYSCAILVPDALGVLDNVEIGLPDGK